MEWLKYGRQENLTSYFFDYATLSINKTIEKWTKGFILFLPKKGNLGITNNYRCITLTAIAAKVHNAMLLNRIQPEIKKFLGKIRTIFGEINLQLYKFWLSIKSFKEQVQKKSWDNTIVCRFLQGIWFQTKERPSKYN